MRLTKQWNVTARTLFSSTPRAYGEKARPKLMAEKLSVVMARRNIRLADMVVVVMDAGEGFLGSTRPIAGYAHEGGRSGHSVYE